MHPNDFIPDVRDGLTRAERVILWQLYVLQKELGIEEGLPPGTLEPRGEGEAALLKGRIRKAAVPTVMLYGRVVEYVDMSQHRFQRLLQRLVGR